jgi:hypothetical protein
MKILVQMALAMFLFSCGLIRKKEDVQSNITGTYIRFSEHEFGREYDTLIISLQNASANEYKVVRRWKYERMVEGRQLPEYKIRVAVAIFDIRRKILQETVSGRIYTVESSGNLFSGSVKYKKL